MLPADRRKSILEQILNKGSANTEALAREYRVSAMTIRRDLRILESQRLIHITHGGAVPVNFLHEDLPYESKQVSCQEAKRAIAKAAAELIEDDSCIILDAGTTTMELALRLRSRRLTVITTDLQIALVLSKSPDITVHMPGGVVEGHTGALIGEATLDYLASVNAAQAFIGSNVWNNHHGVASTTTFKQHLKRRMMASARQSILLADSSKYGAYSTWRFAALKDFSHIFTDEQLSVEDRASVRASGANLQLVNAESGDAKLEEAHQ
jgi:DeoR/GlpR family transcriptional regulator of sugar metabolism